METDFTSTHNTSTTTPTSYTIEGSLEPITGSNSTSAFNILSGSGFRYFCGDGWIDTGETCDNNNLNGADCTSQGFNSGTLTCNSTCTALVTSACATVASGGGGGGGGGSGSSSQEEPDAPEVDETLTDEDFFTYDDEIILYGTMDTDTESIEVNESSDDVEYPDDDSWSATVALEEGDNTFTIVAVNDDGESEEVVITISRHISGDINNDGDVDDYDLSKLVRMWGGSNQDGDFNSDGIVDDYDFSIFVSRWS